MYFINRVNVCQGCAQDGGAPTMKFWLPRNGEAGGD